MSDASLAQFLMSIPWFAWIAIVGILCGSITGAVGGWLRHRERIEMIRHGIHPDAPSAVGKPEDLPEL